MITDQRLSEIEAIPDKSIDTSDIPEAGDEFFKMAEFRVMDRTGDGLKLTWNANNTQEVRAARETFQHYKDRGYDLFRLGEDDERGSVMAEFDAAAPGILAVPRMRGG